MTVATLAGSLLSTQSARARGERRGWTRATRVARAWLILTGALLVVLPAANALFGRQRIEQPDARALAGVELDAASRATLARLDHVREDLQLIGATSSLTSHLRSGNGRSGDGGETPSAAADLRQFVLTKDWCAGIGLASAGRAALTVERDGRGLGCDPLFAIVGGLTPGTLVLDRVDVAGAPRLCAGLSLEADSGAAALVAEADPAVLFPEVSLASGDDGPFFLADAHGRWLVGPPPNTPLVKSPLALSSWQGPAGGRWEIARTALPLDVRGPVARLSLGASAGTISLVAALMTLALTWALDARQRMARLWVTCPGHLRG